MKKQRLVWLIWLVFSSGWAVGQKPPRHLLKLEATSFLLKNAGLAYEFRPNRHSGVEIEAHFWNHPIASSLQIFQGDLKTEYADRRVDSLFFPGNFLLNFPSWKYLNSNRPLPEVPRFLAKNTLQFRFGYRFLFETKRRRLGFALQPSLVATRSRFFEINEHFSQPKPEVVTVAEYPQTVGTLTLVTTTRFWEQNRQMRLRERWLAGLNYDFAMSWRPTHRFFLEGRAIGGVHASRAFSENPPNEAKWFYARFSLQIGYILNKNVEKLPTKPKKRVIERL